LPSEIIRIYRLNQPKTFVILSPGFPKDEQDSTCLPAQQLFVRSLNSLYPELKVIVIAFEYPFSMSSYRWFDNLVIPFNGWNRRGLKKLATWFRVWRMLQKIQRENELLGLLSFWCSRPALVGKYFSEWNSQKHLIWILGQDAQKSNRYIPFIRPTAENLVAMSDFLAKEFQENHSVFPKYLIPNGVDPSQYSQVALPRDIDILGVGSLISLKQYDRFLSYVHEVKQIRPDLHVMICGKGPEETRLTQMIHDLQLDQQVVLVGEQSHGEVIRLMQRSRVLLHTSAYEGFSTVCLEALYAGAQVVSFCKPMNRLVPNWHIVNPAETVEKLLDLLNNRIEGNNSVLLYSMKDSARDMLKLFDYPATMA
jgi:glycosyltransferase involved in cell wall biosynthesis